jgi:RimJ/RimL family protein N-acetyltransferase
LDEVRERPLHAHVVEHNAASLRVLEKCGFTRCSRSVTGQDGVVQAVLELRA